MFGFQVMKQKNLRESSIFDAQAEESALPACSAGRTSTVNFNKKSTGAKASKLGNNKDEDS